MRRVTVSQTSNLESWGLFNYSSSTPKAALRRPFSPRAVLSPNPEREPLFRFLCVFWFTLACHARPPVGAKSAPAAAGTNRVGRRWLLKDLARHRVSFRMQLALRGLRKAGKGVQASDPMKDSYLIVPP